ncbi:DUF2637 domain-containing protein [Streptomyces sp. NBC_00102]|uniref:DUF2637 domain-containing protein n=1 Tax=Streptomyces sp. NBC_00102 TaxID=2975652 RepID=UPI00224FCE22|nr:DUF2637 domain-containing protein [Streptomyces sp. NBC_00102]MCX5398172.1 DUF2637 domain-containing protein [Streptomyces sp. NBC_00102]
MPRKIRPDAVLIQAFIAGALSFSHLHDLASAAGQDGWKAWAYPISVDLLLVAAWRRMRTTSNNRPAWVWFVIALTASLGANIATAGLLNLGQVPAWLRILVAGWPALAFLGGTLLAHTPTEPAPTATTAPLDTPEPTPAPDTHKVTVRVPEPAPELPPAPVPAPAAAPVAVPAVSVPPALLDHAKKVADNHRASTGNRIDLATLRLRLGVPAPLADAINAQLA